MQREIETDVLIVGLGGAGACAAIEARHAGADVVVLERFTGGGATAISGGVVYAGGGTFIQQDAAVTDDVEDMFRYLQLEVGDVVSDEVLRDFCEHSASNLRWLAEQGAVFDSALCPVKTSYPTDDYFLYYSGNEGFSPYRDAAKPAPRGHRVRGKSLPGRNLFAPLQAQVHRLGAQVHYHSRVQRLLVDNGRVQGVEASIVQSGVWSKLHGWLEKYAIKLVNYMPRQARKLRRWGRAIEVRHGITVRAMARRGVILSAGGFVTNRDMISKFAPKYRPGMPLGTAGCSGDGIRMGLDAGGAVSEMKRVSAWRFLNPPEAFVHGVLLNRSGERYVNESLYGAAVGEAMVEDNGGVGILVIDEGLRKLAKSQVGRGKTQWFQTGPALLNLWFNCRRADNVAALAAICRCPEASLQQTLDDYNSAIESGEPDAYGKELRSALAPPFFAIDCSITSRMWPLPTLTLGGLVVCEESGQVCDEDGAPIPGLYSAGRNALGICSRQYVSGLSIADCVYSGRRAGRSAASATTL